jgi:type IV pilus assembly protein PilC
LEILADQQRNPKFKEVIVDIMLQLESGVALNEAVAQHPKVFPPLHAAMIRAGEESGRLAQALTELADQLRAQLRLRRAIKSATVYPKVVSAFAFLIITGLLMTIVPTFANLFEETVAQTQTPDENGNLPDASLPWLTQQVVNVSQLLYPDGSKKGFGYWLNFDIIPPMQIGVLWRFVLFFGLIILIRKGTKRLLMEPGPRRAWDGFKLRAPLRIGTLIQKIAVARFTRTLSSLLNAGVGAPEAMTIVADTAGNVLVTEAILDARERLMQGATISEPLARSDVFPPMVPHMVAVGEETGELEQMLLHIAEYFEEEVEMAIKSLTSIIEPLMILIVGFAIGIIIIAIYLPMFKLYDLIGTETVFAPFVARYFYGKAMEVKKHWKDYKRFASVLS